MLAAAVGSSSTCLTGPTKRAARGVRRAVGPRAASLCYGLLAILFELFAPLFATLMLATPPAYITTLAGLAMLRVLQASFVTAFATRFTLGALVTFIVTVSDVTVLNIGAAFWGLVAGLLVSLLLERPHFAESVRD